ncbi:MAG: hypothetical protein FJ403_13090 [Verrucomicrobia bacterium]|nr:hypothetical protein [Verrucomicrobiota bacterium]
MKTEGTTSLGCLEALPQDERALLDSMWVESVEELIAALAAAHSRKPPSEPVPSGMLESARQRALTLVGARNECALSSSRPAPIHGRHRVESEPV